MPLELKRAKRARPLRSCGSRHRGVRTQRKSCAAWAQRDSNWAAVRRGPVRMARWGARIGRDTMIAVKARRMSLHATDPSAASPVNDARRACGTPQAPPRGAAAGTPNRGLAGAAVPGYSSGAAPAFRPRSPCTRTSAMTPRPAASPHRPGPGGVRSCVSAGGRPADGAGHRRDEQIVEGIPGGACPSRHSEIPVPMEAMTR